MGRGKAAVVDYGDGVSECDAHGSSVVESHAGTRY